MDEIIYYDKQGNAIDVVQWGRYFENLDYRVVARDILDDGKVVSTVWLGIDHSFGDTDTPVLFETMVFPSETEWSEIYMNRYNTEEEALAGHAEAIEVARTL
jgi:hypothetical protein